MSHLLPELFLCKGGEQVVKVGGGGGGGGGLRPLIMYCDNSYVVDISPQPT